MIEILWLRLCIAKEQIHRLWLELLIAVRKRQRERLVAELEETRAVFIRLGGARKIMEIDEKMDKAA